MVVPLWWKGFEDFRGGGYVVEYQQLEVGGFCENVRVGWWWRRLGVRHGSFLCFLTFETNI